MYRRSFRTHPRRVYQVDRVLMYIMIRCPTNKLLRQWVYTNEYRNPRVVITSSIIIHLRIYSTFFKIPTSFFPRVSLGFPKNLTLTFSIKYTFFFSIEKKIFQPLDFLCWLGSDSGQGNVKNEQTTEGR